ncbi:Unknown protein [Striga hermonthica]|uniref:Dymeclin n=1 Tax=Striga hermonthica TaxID=68872 RepID=A0A9N7N8H8_STRHE|nr:Unknown protein [Striga hermonthica]
MGGVPSTPLVGGGAPPQDTAENLIGAFIGSKSFPLADDYWEKLLDAQLDLRWPPDRVRQACQLFAMNNCNTRHLVKILIHLAWCLQDCSASDVPSPAYPKALNALFMLSVFLKNLIENAKSDNFEELYLSLGETEPTPTNFSKGKEVENFVMYSALNFIARVDISPGTYLLHHELLDFMLIAMSTQLLSGPSPGLDDKHPFIDAAMVQELHLVNSVVHKLFLNYLIHPGVLPNSLSYTIFPEGNQADVLRRVANLVLVPFHYIASSTSAASRSRLAESSLNILLILSHYHKCMRVDGKNNSDYSSSESVFKEDTYFLENPYRKAVENVRDTEFNRVDIKGNAQSDPLVRLPFASLFDTLGMCMADETAVLLLYSLVHGNPYFLEYVLVRTDLDTLLMPMLETLYDAPRKMPNHIYMVLIILLILSQDSSFNASIHKLMLPSVPWYQERLLHQTSLGSLLIIILIRTVKYNLSKLRDMYLHTNCLAILANMAPHVHRLSAYASQQLLCLFDMLSRKYNKLADVKNEKMIMADGGPRGENLPDDPLAELHIYTDFLRLVLEILNSILTYALPRNPEVVYAILHRQEVLLPFKNHPRFNELLENIYTVLDFFNSRIETQERDDDWSVEKVLQIIINNCRSWRGEGMKMFTQLRFTYEQESHPEEFFTPYVWQVVLSHSDLAFDPSSINLFPVQVEAVNSGSMVNKLENGEQKEQLLRA